MLYVRMMKKISKVSIPDITDRVNKKETTMYVAL